MDPFVSYAKIEVLWIRTQTHNCLRVKCKYCKSKSYKLEVVNLEFFMSMVKIYLKGASHQGVVHSGFCQDGQVDVEEADIDGAGDDGDGSTLNHLVSML